MDFIGENLDYNEVNFGMETIKYKNGKLSRNITILNEEKNNYYITGTIKTNKISFDEKEFAQLCIRTTNESSDDTNDIINKLNEFKKGLTNRLKYLMKIPTYKDSKYYLMRINNNGKGILTNILLWENKILDLPSHMLVDILSDNRLLIHIMSLTITDDSVYLNLRLSRVILESIHSLNSNDRFKLLKNINFQSTENLNQLKNLEDVNVNKKFTSKNQLKDQLKKICEQC